MTEKSNELSIETALRNREFEIQLFWQRTNYFLVLITALGIGVFSTSIPFLGLTMSIFAALTSWLWFRTNLGSRFWQVFWEDEVERMAADHGLVSFMISTADIQSRMRERVKASKRSLFDMRRQIDEAVIEKPSVTFHMILLSLLSFTFWMCVAAYFILVVSGIVELVEVA